MISICNRESNYNYYFIMRINARHSQPDNIILPMLVKVINNNEEKLRFTAQTSMKLKTNKHKILWSTPKNNPLCT